jgi:hypothetical protein
MWDWGALFLELIDPRMLQARDQLRFPAFLS